jgi:Tfp pilus assembly protein PilF
VSDEPTAANPPRTGGRLALAAGIAVALLTLLVFARCVRFDFVNWDDPLNVVYNPHYKTITGSSIGYFWTHAHFELYMPLTFTLWALGALAGRVPAVLGAFPPAASEAPFSPAPFHLLNVVLHAGSAVAVFALLLRLSRRFGGGEAENLPRRVLASAAGALLFALHPLQVECVAWVTGGNNVVSGFFGLWALYAYLAYAEVDGRGKAAARFTLATVLYVLALLGKPTAASLPLVAFVLETLVLRRPWRRWAPGLALWVALAAAEALVTRASSASSRSADIVLPLWGRPFIVGDALAFYLGKLLWPYPLSVDYGHHPTRVVLASWWGYVTWLVPAAVGILLWRLRPRLRWVGAGGLLFVAATLPVLGIVPFYVHRYSTVADRYVYVGLLGPALALAWAVWAASGSAARLRRPAFATAAMVLAVLAVRTVAQTGVWRDTTALFSHALAFNPRSVAAYNNLGLEYGYRGDLKNAERSFREALRLAPDDARLRFNLGTTLADEGQAAEAAEQMRESLRRAPLHGPRWYTFGAFMARQPGGAEEAVTALERAATLDPTQAEPPYILGVLLGGMQRYAEAEKWCAEAVRLSPNNAEAHFNLALVRDRQGKTAEALPEYREAVRLAPGNARFASALREAEGK